MEQAQRGSWARRRAQRAEGSRAVGSSRCDAAATAAATAASREVVAKVAAPHSARRKGRGNEQSREERARHVGGDGRRRVAAESRPPGPAPFFLPGGSLAENRALPYHAISPVRSEIESCSRVSRQSVTGRRTGITVIPAYSVNSEELFYSDHGGSDSGIDIPQAIPANRASSVDRIGCVDRRSSAISSVVCASRGNL